MRLVDEATITIQSGNGGDGCVSFRREKYVPMGGPNGGNGGVGGSVYFVATTSKSSLLDFRYRPKYQAARGQHGMGSDCDGRGGEDLYLQVPLGTVIFDVDTGEEVGDLTEADTPLLLAEGGLGGRGNRTFTSSTNRAPAYATEGKPGQKRSLRLELRLMADVGLLGMPNAGKSTFLGAVTRANPKVASYPFTTLQPHLGVAYRKQQSFVIADLPGLIEGAAEGTGLGHRFLKHVTRNRLLLHFVDGTASPEELFLHREAVNKELGDFDPELLEREQWIVLTKADQVEAPDRLSRSQALGDDVRWISSHTGEGVGDLLDAIAARVHQWNREAPTETETATEPDPAQSRSAEVPAP